MSTDLASSRRLEARAGYSFVTWVTFVKVKNSGGREIAAPDVPHQTAGRAQDRQLLLERLCAFRRSPAIASLIEPDFM
jgi:hypothetical protein